MAKATVRTETEADDEAALPRALRRQIIFWLLAAAFLILFLYIFSAILLPFLAGMTLAYFLDPVADRLERMGLSRLRRHHRRSWWRSSSSSCWR